MQLFYFSFLEYDWKTFKAQRNFQNFQNLGVRGLEMPVDKVWYSNLAALQTMKKKMILKIMISDLVILICDIKICSSLLYEDFFW